MNAEQFRCPSAGEIIRMIQGYHAVVSAPLPPRLTYDPALVVGLSRADAALSELSGLGRVLPNPHLLIAPYTRREAILSSRIEGTRVSLSELLLDEVEEAGPDRSDERREVRNYLDALDHGIERLRAGFPLSLRLVREIHERLMTGVRGEYATPGEFRRSQNWIGHPGSNPETALYVPPPPDQMMEALGAWEAFLHQRDEWPDLVQCALMHEQFEAIHPFLDGNGRVGRLLITLFLIERERLSQPLLYLSAYIEDHRQDYYDLLQRVRTDGDGDGWLRFFLTGVTEIGQTAVRQASELLDLREVFRSRLLGQPHALALLDELFVNPYLTVPHAARQLGVANPTARRAVAVLQEHGMLKQVAGRSWRQLYISEPILQAIDQPHPGSISIEADATP